MALSDDDLRRSFEAFENRKRYPMLAPSVFAGIGDESVEQESVPAPHRPDRRL